VSLESETPSGPLNSSTNFDDLGFQLEPIAVKQKANSFPFDDESASSNPESEPNKLPDEFDPMQGIPKMSASASESLFDLQAKPQQEFRFPCKVCGTALYARPEEIGKKTRCPDCFSEFTVPSPPKVATKPTGPTFGEMAAMPLAPVQSTREKSREAGRSSVDEYLANAAKELDHEEVELKSVSHDFDTSGWVKNTFSFLGDPTLIIIAVVCGVMLGGVLIFSSIVDGMLATKSEDAGQFGSTLVMLFLGIPILIGTLGNGVAIMECAANKMKRVTRWPMFTPVEMIGELTMVATAFAFAALPGGLLGWMLTSVVGWDQAVALGTVLLSTVLLFPIFLLGMLDNQSIGQPISSEVVESLKTRAEAWAAMYFMSGLSCLGIFLGWLATRDASTTFTMAYGVALPFLIYFVFHQMGVLASRISFFIDEDNSDDDEEMPKNSSSSSSSLENR
jgi:hypothetical protein